MDWASHHSKENNHDTKIDVESDSFGANNLEDGKRVLSSRLILQNTGVQIVFNMERKEGQGRRFMC